MISRGRGPEAAGARIGRVPPADAAKRSYAESKRVGFCLVVVDAKDEKAADFFFRPTHRVRPVPRPSGTPVSTHADERAVGESWRTWSNAATGLLQAHSPGVHSPLLLSVVAVPVGRRGSCCGFVTYRPDSTSTSLGRTSATGRISTPRSRCARVPAYRRSVRAMG